MASEAAVHRPPLHVCLLSPNALPVADSNYGGYFGGAATRAWTFAFGLANCAGDRVTLVVQRSRPVPRLIRDKVDILTLADPWIDWRENVGVATQRSPNFPWIRFCHWQWNLLWQFPVVVLERLQYRVRRFGRPHAEFTAIDADVFGTFGLHAASLDCIVSAQAIGRRVVLFVRTDEDLDDIYRADDDSKAPTGQQGSIGRKILDTADAIVVQTPAQLQTLQMRLGRTGVLIRNPIDLTAWTAVTDDLDPQLRAGLSRFVLWIGRADTAIKRPQVCVMLARKCPQVEFLMVMNPRDPVVEASIRGDLPPNVRIVESVPFQRMPALFRRAAILVHTAPREGFPNVFLQAAASGVPIAALEFGAEFFRESRAGRCFAGDLNAMARYVIDTWEGRGSSASDREHARSYVEEHHNLPRQSALLHDLMQSLCSAPVK